jgi:hypothetical protein
LPIISNRPQHKISGKSTKNIARLADLSESFTASVTHFSITGCAKPAQEIRIDDTDPRPGKQSNPIFKNTFSMVIDILSL